jgi:hypothetical protein
VEVRHGGRRVLVKGRSRKELVQVESDDEHTKVQLEVLRTSVVVLDLASGAVEVVEQGGDERKPRPVLRRGEATTPSSPGSPSLHTA